MKFYLTTLLSLLLIPAIGFAATNDFIADANITVADVTFGGSTADMIIFDGSTSESWTFDSGTFTVTNPGSAFQVGSSNSSVKSIQISQSGSTLVCAENTTPGTSYATLPTSSGTYTISPSATTDCTSLCTTLTNTATYNSYPTCGAATCNSNYTLSGSGSSATCISVGGGGAPGTVGMLIPVPGLATVVEPEAPEVAKPSPVAQLISPVFNSTLRYGMTSDDIERLQQLLAQDPEIYPEGIVSGWFGSLTKKAVQKFQAKYGIVSSGDEGTTGYGLVGPSTRAKLAEVFAEQPVVSASAVFTSGMEKGMSGADTKRLQQLLNSDSDTMIASSGVGSPGNETEYFGSLTEKAVQKFQAKYGVATVGDVGYGYVGPKTRAKIAEVFGGQETETPTETSEVSDEMETQLESQIQQLLDQINSLQLELNEMM